MRALLQALRTAVRAAHRANALPEGPCAHLFGLDALTVSVTTSYGLEPLWCDAPGPFGPQIDDLQYTVKEGPAHDAVRTGETVTEPDLAASPATRWPVLRLHAGPVGALVAIPLRVKSRTIGVLNGYRTRPGPVTDDHLDALRSLAHLVLHLYLHTPRNAPATPRQPDADHHLFPLRNAEVHQATGMLATQLELPLNAAHLRLRTYAIAHDRPLTEVAHAITTRQLRPEQ
ncbi:GAF and ANTAR domain-containing protein [Streptomyces sp. NPDC055210]